MYKVFILLVVTSLLLSSCSKSTKKPRQSRYAINQDSAPKPSQFDEAIPGAWDIKPEPKSRYGNHSPYKVFGKTYYVSDNNNNFKQTGTASWYGKKFHGHTTSNMEIFDMYKYTAAHRTLPLPSFVEVTNLDNNKKVIVRVNDRGPFKSKRIIDLSWAAAKVLDYDKKGLANVRLVLLQSPGMKRNVTPVQKPTAQTPQIIEGSKYLQVGAFSLKENALMAANKVRQAIIQSVKVTNTANPNLLYRVRIGPLTQEDNIIDIIQVVNDIGFSNATMVRE